MSILFEKDNCVLISHEIYLNNLYKNVNGESYTIKNDLFAINAPFKTYKVNKRKEQEPAHSNISQKRKRDAIEQEQDGVETVNELQTDIAFVETKYNELKAQIKAFLNDYLSLTTANQTNSGTNNAQAIKIANKLTQNEFRFVGNGANIHSKCINHSVNKTNVLFPPDCRFYARNITSLAQEADTLNALTDFDVILMDPPWWNKAIRRKNLQTSEFGITAKSAGYAMLYDEQIKEIPVDGFLKQNGVVFVWCTNAPSHLAAIDEFFAAWGITKCGKWYWLKVTRDGEPIIEFGEPPRKQPFEQIIIGSKNAQFWRQHVNKVIVSIPSSLHSHKPPLSELIKRVIGVEVRNIKCMELFARYLLPGWTSIGLEVLKLQNECFYTSMKNTNT